MKEEDIDSLIPGKTRIIYVPHYVNGDMNHPAVEQGTVSSVYERIVFVKFDKQVNLLGWDETTAQGCHIEDLIIIN